MTPQQKLAKLLRTEPETIIKLEKKMNRVTGKKDVIQKIVKENDELIKQRLKQLGLKRNCSAEEIYLKLIEKAKFNDQALFKHFREPEFSTVTGCRTLINATKELTNDLTGLYLTEEKARQLLKLNPPKNIMSALGYGNDIKKMLAKENIFEIFCALRFVEEEKWLNGVFFKPYQYLKKEDFERRKIKVLVLSRRWLGIGQRFLGKKLHHMSHLKEMGVVFVIPTENHGIGETLYLFFMTLHYLYETNWHSALFERYIKNYTNFAPKIIAALKVKVSNFPLPDSKKASWRIVPKYLAKKDSSDPRLFEPHVSPEAFHYSEVSSAINRFASRFPDLELGFWENLDWVGDYFKSENSNGETLISFDLYDNGIDLLKQSDFRSKYLYHQQEVLWNKIFREYMDREVLEELMIKNFGKGYFSL